MCFPPIIAAMNAAGLTAIALPGAAATAATAATAAAPAVGSVQAWASMEAKRLLAEQSLALTMSNASIISSTLLELGNFAVSAQQAAAQGDQAAKTYLKEQMQLRERERQEELKHQVNLDMLARNAAMGMATTKTAATARGVAGEEAIMAFAIKENEIASFERANLKMEKSALAEASDQSFFKAKSAIDTAQSATGPLAFMGLGAGIAGGYFDSYRMFGAVPFEGQTNYAARLGIT